MYIPEDFLKDVNNMDKVYDILSMLNNDLVNEDLKDKVVKKLEDLGELKVIEKLLEGFFSFGA